MGPRSLISTEANSDSIQFLPLQPCPDISFFIERGKIEKFVFRLNCLYIQHLKYILFCCTLVSKCIKVDFTETWVNCLRLSFCHQTIWNSTSVVLKKNTGSCYTLLHLPVTFTQHTNVLFFEPVTFTNSTMLMSQFLRFCYRECWCTGQSSLWLVLILGLEAADHLLQPLFI